MFKLFSLFAMLAIGEGTQLKHRHQHSMLLQTVHTCVKSMTEVIRDGETGMVGPNSDVTFSSTFDDNILHKSAWFHNVEPRSCWGSKTNDANQWIQVNFPEAKSVTAVAVGMRTRYNQYVSKFTLEYSVDGNTWSTYNKGQVLDGVYERDHDAYFRNELTPFTAKMVRLHPTEWVGHVALIYNVYVKDIEQASEETTTEDETGSNTKSDEDTNMETEDTKTEDETTTGEGDTTTGGETTTGGDTTTGGGDTTTGSGESTNGGDTTTGGGDTTTGGGDTTTGGGDTTTGGDTNTDSTYYIISATYGDVDLESIQGDLDLTDSFNAQLKAGVRTFSATAAFIKGDSKVLVITYMYQGKQITELCKDGESITLPA